MHKELMMNMDFHWQATEDVLHTLSMWPPLDLLHQVHVLFALGSSMLDAEEGQHSLPHLLHSLFLVQPKTYMIYMNVMSIFSICHICKQNISCSSSPLMIFSLVFFSPLPYMFISDTFVDAINSETPFVYS